MAQVTYCDICHEVIHNGHKKYILGVNAVVEKEGLNHKNCQDVYDELERRAENSIYGKIQLKEICEGCKQVLERFFVIRQADLAKAKKEIEKLLKNKTREPEEEK